jgi:hypothetical protein
MRARSTQNYDAIIWRSLRRNKILHCYNKMRCTSLRVYCTNSFQGVHKVTRQNILSFIGNIELSYNAANKIITGRLINVYLLTEMLYLTI